MDEAIRGNVDEMTDDEYEKAFNAFAVNMKGSNELIDMFEMRMYRNRSEGLFK